MVFTNPQSTSYEERVRDRGVLGRFFEPGRLETARKLASFHLSYLAPTSPGRRILDFGCGEGAFVRQAKEEGWNAIGVDLNERLVSAANEHWEFDLLHYKSLDDLRAGNCRFDAIYSNQVFEHLRRPVEVGRALAQLLNPGGIIYIEVPNASRLQERLERGRTLDPTSHFNHFTAASLSTLVRRIGCVPVYASGSPGMVRAWQRLGVGPFVNPLARVTRRILPGIGGGACAIGKRVD
jgi:2-polyprenyl-3-methyl-5-hydroxy-6-metoxy-1,4-benzoquinol methylase